MTTDKTALIVVDMQNDFMPGGSLAIGDSSAEGLTDAVLELVRKDYEVKVALKDWHSDDHSSFTIWPPHCIAGTQGAELVAGLEETMFDLVVKKGRRTDVDSYSGFTEDDGASTGLAEFLHERGIADVTVCGLVTDICVKKTALDAVKCGFRTSVDLNASRALELPVGNKGLTSLDAAICEMKDAGIVFIEKSPIPGIT